MEFNFSHPGNAQQWFFIQFIIDFSRRQRPAVVVHPVYLFIIDFSPRQRPAVVLYSVSSDRVFYDAYPASFGELDVPWRHEIHARGCNQARFEHQGGVGRMK
jgi:hypothetical protein